MPVIEGPIPAVAVAIGAQPIDPCFKSPKEVRSAISHDHFGEDLPLIDLGPVLNLKRLQKEITFGQDVDSKPQSGVQEEIEQCKEARARVEREIRAACEEYGFFQVVNHGFPLEVVEQLMESGRQLFDLPLEEKMKVAQTPSTKEKPIKSPGYIPLIRSNTYQKVRKVAWNEGFGMDFPEVLYPGRLEQDVTTLWPEEPERTSRGLQLRSIGEEYAKQANSLSLLLLDLMAASLGLPEGSLQGFLGSGPRAQLEARCNVGHYPICPHPDLALALFNHTDPSLITTRCSALMNLPFVLACTSMQINLSHNRFSQQRSFCERLQ
ncbi:unnamed protein product [Calypogeia fissa]